MFHAAFASLSASNPQAGQECSRTHDGLSVETPQDAHSFVVFRGSTATKCVPSRSHLYSSNERNVCYAADAVLRLFDVLVLLDLGLSILLELIFLLLRGNPTNGDAGDDGNCHK